jgi:hypothetical protein
MVPDVPADHLPRLGDPPDQLRVGGGLAADHEEGCWQMRAGQERQNPRRHDPATPRHP